jgi:uncharacterized protein YcbK (DUF882 family)
MLQHRLQIYPGPIPEQIFSMGIGRRYIQYQLDDEPEGTEDLEKMDDRTEMDRRKFLRLSGLSTLGGLLFLQQVFASPASANTAPDGENIERRLFLLNTHTGERFNDVYWSAGSYDAQALSTINNVLRDHRTGDIHPIDPALLDQLSTLATKLDVKPEFHIISGFRSPKTNKALRNKGRNVARKSYHLLGQAVDVRLPGTDVGTLHKTALALRQGGVGLYKNQNFIHVDTGPVRHW